MQIENSERSKRDTVASRENEQNTVFPPLQCRQNNTFESLPMWVGSFLFCNVDVVTSLNLTLKAPITTAADDIHEYCFNVFFSENIRLDVSSESSARQRIHTKNQALFSSKHKMSSSAIFVWRFKG